MDNLAKPNDETELEAIYELIEKSRGLRCEAKKRLEKIKEEETETKTLTFTDGETRRLKAFLKVLTPDLKQKIADAIVYDDY